MTLRRTRTAAAMAQRRRVIEPAAPIDAIARFCCRHQFVGHPGFLKCAICAHRVTELPLSKPGATILRGGRFGVR